MTKVPYYFFAAAIFCGSAHATCGHNGIPDEVCPTPASPVADAVTANPANVANAAASAAAAANAQQQQGQRQRQGQRQISTSSAAGAGAGAGSNSGNVTIQGAQAGSGSSYRAIALPHVPPIPPTVVPGASISTTVISCGPLLAVWREPIAAHYDGIVTHHERQQGWTYGFGPAVDYGGDDFRRSADGRVYGNSAIVTYAVATTGHARQLVLGGGSTGGAWGQGGVGGSGANQQLVKDVTLLPCQVQIVQGFAPVGYAPAPVVVAPVRRAPRKPVKAKAPAVAASVAAESCVETATMACRRPPMGIKLN